MTKEVAIPILNHEYRVYFTWGTFDEVKKILKKHQYPMDRIEEEATFDGRGSCFHAKGCHPVIAMPCLPETPEEIGTLAHEATHAINDIWNKISENSMHECYAHSVGAIVRTVLNKSLEEKLKREKDARNARRKRST